MQCSSAIHGRDYAVKKVGRRPFRTAKPKIISNSLSQSVRTIPYPERSEEPLGLGGEVSGLEDELDGLLSILSVSDFLKGFRRDGSFETLEVESVSGGEEVVVVDRLSCETQFVNSSS